MRWERLRLKKGGGCRCPSKETMMLFGGGGHMCQKVLPSSTFSESCKGGGIPQKKNSIEKGKLFFFHKMAKRRRLALTLAQRTFFIEQMFFSAPTQKKTFTQEKEISWKKIKSSKEFSSLSVPGESSCRKSLIYKLQKSFTTH